MRIGELLKRIKEKVEIQDNEEYKRVTIRSKNQGIFLRDISLGSKIGTKKQFLIREGQFLLSKIDARNGAFGIVPSELDTAIITSNFWTYEVNQEILNIEWFNLYVSSESFINVCEKSSSGTTNRKYLDEKLFLNFEINLPTLEEQIKTVELYKNKKSKYNDLLKEINKQEVYISNLRNEILGLAVQGKLVPQNENEESASILIERANKEKERLVKENKFKKNKLFPNVPKISEDEIPYELPKNWKWVRITEITAMNDNSIRRGPFGSEITKDMFVSKGNETYKIYEQKNAIKKDSELGDYYIGKEHYEKLKRFNVTSGDIIISCAGTIGETYILPEDIEEGIINQALLKIRLNENVIDDMYFINMFKSLTQKELNKSAKGSAIKNLVSVDYLKKKVCFPLPPLEEQKRIVEKIDSLMALCDELEKEINNSKQLSEMLMAKLLDEELSK